MRELLSSQRSSTTAAPSQSAVSTPHTSLLISFPPDAIYSLQPRSLTTRHSPQPTSPCFCVIPMTLLLLLCSPRSIRQYSNTIITNVIIIILFYQLQQRLVRFVLHLFVLVVGVLDPPQAGARLVLFDQFRYQFPLHGYDHRDAFQTLACPTGVVYNRST